MLKKTRPRGPCPSPLSVARPLSTPAPLGLSRCLYKSFLLTLSESTWPKLEKQKADWLPLTEVRVRQREIRVMQEEILSSGYDSEWRKPVESANECGGVSFCCKTSGFAAVVPDEYP